MKYECPACGERFASLAEKKHHTREEHPRSKN